MITVLIGHRGVGKTSLLKRLNQYFPESLCFCLDEEIEKRFGAITDIFLKDGETYFRNLEKKVFNEIYQQAQENQKVFIALGAGFEGEIPSNCDVIYVQRAVDLSKFAFLNRPSLSEDKNNLLIPINTFKARDERYQKLATQEYLLPEGEFETLAEEEQLFKSSLAHVRGALTLFSRDVERANFAEWIKERVNWGVSYFEVRDDLLTLEQIKKIFLSVPKEKRLLSFRRLALKEQTLALCAECELIDWPYEFGEIPESIKNHAMLSLHSENNEFEADLHKVSRLTGRVKWSPVINTLGELAKAHQWVIAQKGRSLLPRSSSGKWSWYRLLQKDRQDINFLREGAGSAIDQPSLIQWVQRDSRHKTFAAVLGSPVLHSYSPQFHRDFFKSKKRDFLAVDVSQDELIHGGFDFLQSLGFKSFAVTSPLKSWAGQLVGQSDPLNTLAWSDKEKVWFGTSTDKAGFSSLIQKAEILFTRGKNTVIWGGGGVLPALQDVLPLAQLYSAQNGRPRPHNAMVESPSTVVWAGGETLQTILSCHPAWKPERVVDLNYRGDSLGIHYAQSVGARYYSGHEMFLAQALEQQRFWSHYE